MIAIRIGVIRNRCMKELLGAGDVDVKLLAASLRPDTNREHDRASLLEHPHVSRSHFVGTHRILPNRMTVVCLSPFSQRRQPAWKETLALFSLSWARRIRCRIEDKQ